MHNQKLCKIDNNNSGKRLTVCDYFFFGSSYRLLCLRPCLPDPTDDQGGEDIVSKKERKF